MSIQSGEAVNEPLTLKAFNCSAGSPDITISLNRAPTAQEARRLAWKINNVIEREASHTLHGSVEGKHDGRPPD